MQRYRNKNRGDIKHVKTQMKNRTQIRGEEQDWYKINNKYRSQRSNQ